MGPKPVGALPLLYSSWPGRRIGQRWRATRAPSQGPVVEGIALGYPFSLSLHLHFWHQRDKRTSHFPLTFIFTHRFR